MLEAMCSQTPVPGFILIRFGTFPVWWGRTSNVVSSGSILGEGKMVWMGMRRQRHWASKPLVNLFFLAFLSWTVNRCFKPLASLCVWSKRNRTFDLNSLCAWSVECYKSSFMDSSVLLMDQIQRFWSESCWILLQWRMWPNFFCIFLYSIPINRDKKLSAFYSASCSCV